MGWLRRPRGPGPAEDAPSEETGPAPVERAAPGAAALLEGLHEGGGHAVLDLGPASEGSFRLYSRFARRIRFADLLTAPPERGSWTETLDGLPRYAEQPYDVVVLWNLFDRVEPEERGSLAGPLVRLTAPGARLYALVDTAGQAPSYPRRFTLLDGGRVREEIVGPRHPSWRKLLPAEVERLLHPFRVVQAFVLKGGIREYLAVRPAEEPTDPQERLRLG